MSHARLVAGGSLGPSNTNQTHVVIITVADFLVTFRLKKFGYASLVKEKSSDEAFRWAVTNVGVRPKSRCLLVELRHKEAYIRIGTNAQLARSPVRHTTEDCSCESRMRRSASSPLVHSKQPAERQPSRTGEESLKARAATPMGPWMGSVLGFGIA